MALIHCDFFSTALSLNTSMCVILPNPAEPPDGGFIRTPDRRRHPTLTLLHGLSDDHTIWQRRTSIERYVAGMNLAVVMPTVHRSFYADMARGSRYWTFVSEELPALARSFFPLSDAREENFVAGLSMGGYGAMRLALTYPERYAAGASLSGALDLVGLVEMPAYEPIRAEFENIFGDPHAIAGSSHDLLHLLDQLPARGGARPRLFQWCGTEDALYAGNARFRSRAKKAGVEVTYEEGPGGHEWGCWDRQIQRVLAWLPLPR